MFARYRLPEQVPARRLLAIGFVLALAAHSASPVAAAVGDLDDTFDDNGKMTLDFGAGDDFLWDVAIQSGDQKIVAVGQWAAGDAQWLILRLNPDGTPDATFSDDGFANLGFSTGDDYATALAIQTDGKIVVAGRASGSGGRFGIARFNTDGTLDSTFSSDGKTTTDFTTGDDIAWDVGIAADDKIVVGGRSAGSDPRFAVARYNPDGTPDETFSSDGKATANLTTGEDNGIALALYDSGKVVLAGYASGSGGQIGLARFRAGGTLDTGFSGDGKLTKNLTSGLEVAWGVAIQPGDDKIVVGGRTGGANSKFVALRYNVDGSPDNTFSGNGNFSVDITSFQDDAYDLVLQSDGKILLAGTADYEFFAVVRLTDTGTVDSSFAHGGTMIVNFTPGYDIATGIAVESDGDVVVVGSSSGGGGKASIARLLGT
jgi:uncharacterized delta-60 repeat protein